MTPSRGRRTIIQLSDTHIVPPGELLYGKLDTAAAVVRALEHVERSGLAPIAVLLSGDVADTGDPRAYRRLRDAVRPASARLRAPVLPMMGNHDEWPAFRAALLDGAGEWFERARFDRDRCDYVARLGGTRLVVLDSTIPGSHHGRLLDDQLAWLRDVLAEPAPDGSVLALHHPPVPSPVDLEGLELDQPWRLADVLRGTDVRIILSGHAHHASGAALAGIPVWVAGSTAYAADAAFSHISAVAGSAYTRVDLYADTVVATSLQVPDGPPLYELSQAQLDAYAARQREAHADAAARTA